MHYVVLKLSFLRHVYHDGVRCISGASTQRFQEMFCTKFDILAEAGKPWNFVRAFPKLSVQRFVLLPVSSCSQLWNHAGSLSRTGHERVVQGSEHELDQGAGGHQHQLYHVRLSQAAVRHLLTADHARVSHCSIVYTKGERCCTFRFDVDKF